MRLIPASAARIPQRPGHCVIRARASHPGYPKPCPPHRAGHAVGYPGSCVATRRIAGPEPLRACVIRVRAHVGLASLPDAQVTVSARRVRYFAHEQGDMARHCTVLRGIATKCLTLHPVVVQAAQQLELASARRQRMNEHDAIILIAGTAWLLPLLRAALHPINQRKENDHD